MENVSKSKKEKLEEIIIEFCENFLKQPYMCYTEHGWHAYFYSKFLKKWKETTELMMKWEYKICIIQKEYPTLSPLIYTTKRQHWDIAMLDEDNGEVIEIDSEKLKKATDKELKLQDRLKLFAVIEFGMNANNEHFNQDMKRLSHKDAVLQAKNRYIVNLVRLGKFSGRDIITDPFEKRIPKDEKNVVKVYHVVAGEIKKYYIDGVEQKKGGFND